MRTPSVALALLALLTFSCASSTPDTVARPQRLYVPATPGGAGASDPPAETIGGKGRSEDPMKPVVMIQTAPPPTPHTTTPRVVRPPPSH